MIGQYIPTNDKYWLFLLELKDIVEISFSHKVAIGHVIYLQEKNTRPLSVI